MAEKWLKNGPKSPKMAQNGPKWQWLKWPKWLKWLKVAKMAESCKKKWQWVAVVAVGWRENKQNRKFPNCIFLGFF
jgi:hypothetical protein